MKLRIVGCALVSLAAVASAPLHADGSHGQRFGARLTSFQEVPTLSTPARGEITLRISRSGDSLTYSLSYRDLEGDVTQAHIHFGDRHVNGGISIWLCSNLASPPTPPNVPACPAPSGSVTGTVSAEDVVGPAGQGIDAGEFAEVLRAIRSGVTYANVHSTKYPGGEIRGQIIRGSDRDD